MPSPRTTKPIARRDIFAERYVRRRDRLSPSFRRVAEFIAANRIEVLTFSALELGKAIGTSDATVVRAVQALGFEGLHDLRTELAASYDGRNTPADNLTRTWANVGETTEAAMDDVLASLSDALDMLRTDRMRAALLEALKILHVANRIAVFGVGTTAHIAAYFAARLRRKGRRQLVLDQTGASLADQLLELERGDAVLMMAYGTPYREAEATVLEARRQQLPLVLITDSLQGSLGRHAAAILPVPRGRSEGIALHGATVACLEMLLLGLATSDQDAALGALRELDRLRKTTRPTRRAMRGAGEAEDE